MTVKLSSLKRDVAKEREGDLIEAEDLNKPGTKPEDKIFWNVRSINYPPFVIARDAANAKLRRKYKGDPVPEEIEAKIFGELQVEHLLLGWKGLDEEFSRDVAHELLTSVEGGIVRQSIFFAATKVGQSDVEFVEDTGKN